MKVLDDLREMLLENLEEIVEKGRIDRGQLGEVHVMTDTIKNTLKIKNLMDSSYSYDGGWNASGTYSNDGRSGSYANSQRGYSNDGMSRYSGMHYVRGHYSRGKDFEKKIQEMMRNDRLSHEEKKTLEEAMEMLKDC